MKLTKINFIFLIFFFFLVFTFFFSISFVSAASVGTSEMTKGKVVYTPTVPPPFINYSTITTNSSPYWGSHFYTDYDLLVPYTGADKEVDLGSQNLTTAGIGTDEDYLKIYDDIMTDRWGNSKFNTFLGIDVCGADDLQASGIQNTGIGYKALENITIGDANTMVGYKAGGVIASTIDSTGIGRFALGFNTGGFNTALGSGAGVTGDGSGCVFLGFSAGWWETGSNKLFIDNLPRANETDARVKALIYGVFDADPENQVVVINANLTTTGTGTFGNINLGEYIYHDGDPDTYIRMETDSMKIYAGGRFMMYFKESPGIDYIEILPQLRTASIIGNGAFSYTAGTFPVGYFERTDARTGDVLGANRYIRTHATGLADGAGVATYFGLDDDNGVLQDTGLFGAKWVDVSAKTMALIFNTRDGGLPPGTVAYQRMTILGNGNIGFNSNEPTFPLQSNTAKNSITGTNVDVSELSLFLRNPADDNDEALGIGFGISGNALNVGAAIIHERVGSQSTGKLHFATKGASVAGADIPIRMTIDNNGYVGIGTLNPTHTLNVVGDVNITGTIINDAIYCESSELVDQTFAVAGARYRINISNVDEGNGITMETGNNGTNISIDTPGVYHLVAQPQVKAGAGGAGDFHMWIEKYSSGAWVDISDSNIELKLSSLEEDVIVLATTLKLNQGEKLRLVVSVSDNKILLHAQSPAGEPVIPSIIFTMYRIGS